MYEDQCKVDRDGADSDASSSEPTTGRDAGHSPGPVSSPLRFNRSSRGRSESMNKLYFYASRSLGGNMPKCHIIYKPLYYAFTVFQN